MNVVLNLERHIIVDHQVHIRDVKTPRCHISRDKHANLVISEGLEDLVASLLCFIAVNSSYLLETFCLQSCIHFIDSDLSFTENDCFLFGLAHIFPHFGKFILLPAHDNVLLDRDVSFGD